MGPTLRKVVTIGGILLALTASIKGTNMFLHNTTPAIRTPVTTIVTRADGFFGHKTYTGWTQGLQIVHRFPGWTDGTLASTTHTDIDGDNRVDHIFDKFYDGTTRSYDRLQSDSMLDTHIPGRFHDADAELSELASKYSPH